MKKEKIDVEKILSNDWEDKGGTPGWMNHAWVVAMDEERKSLYTKAWSDFIPKLPTLGEFNRFFEFANEAKIADKKFWQKCARFVKNKWTERAYPSWILIMNRGYLIRHVVSYEPKLIPSYLWVIRSSRILKILSPWMLNDIYREINPEKALKEVAEILDPKTIGHTQRIFVTIPGLINEYGVERIRKEMEIWAKLISIKEGKKLRKWLEIFSKNKK